MEAYQIAGAALKLAESVFAAGTSLYAFIDGVKRIPETAREFARETEALGTACQLVGKRVRSIAEEQARQLENTNDSKTLLTCLKRQLKDCNRTIRQLQTAVSCVDVSKVDQSNIFKRAVLQIKLSTKTGDIETARNRIRSHTSSLQLIMQSIAIDVAYVIPNRVDIQLREHLDQIVSLRQDLASLRREREIDPEPDQHSNEVMILATSGRVISSGESLYSESVAGGSIMGELMAGKVASIQEWIEDIDAISGSTSVAATTTPDVRSVPINNHHLHPSLAYEKTLSGLVGAKDLEVVADESYAHSQASDDEFAIEAAQHAIRNGRTAFFTKGLSEASESLREALKMVRELPTKHQQMCDLFEVRYMLSICTFHLEDAHAAEEALISVVDSSLVSNPQDESQHLRGLYAAHCLAQTYVMLGKLEAARSTCDSTLQGRLRILGRTHSACLESIALKARITQLQGNQIRAKLFADMLPVDQKQTLVDKYAHLEVGSKAEIPAPRFVVSSESPALFSSTNSNTNLQTKLNQEEKSVQDVESSQFKKAVQDNFESSRQVLFRKLAWEAGVEKGDEELRTNRMKEEKERLARQQAEAKAEEDDEAKLPDVSLYTSANRSNPILRRIGPPPKPKPNFFRSITEQSATTTQTVLAPVRGTCGTVNDLSSTASSVRLQSTLRKPIEHGSKLQALYMADSRFEFQEDVALPKPREFVGVPKRYRAGVSSSAPFDLRVFD